MLRSILLAALIALPAIPAAAQTPAPAAAAAAPTDAERAERGEALVAALAGSAADRAAWVARWTSAQSRDAVAGQLESLARPGLQIFRSDFSRSFDRMYLNAAVRIDMFPARDDPSRISAIFGLPAPTPYDRDVSAIEIADGTALLAEIERRVRYAVERDEFSGTVLVLREGEPFYARSFGLADRDHDVPNAADTRFHLGSMDKMFTAVAIAQLVEQGRLSLDGTVAEILPDYPNREAAASITVRHLLTHSSGLGSWFGRESYDRDARYERMTDWLPVFALEPLEFRPGERASYSNEGFIVLGAIIEAASGMSWYDYVQANIFDRVGMPGTGYPALDEVAPGRAVGYLIAPGDPYSRERRPNWMFLSHRGGSPGGGYSTAADMTAFLIALRDGRLASLELIERMTSPAEGGLRNYGMGFQTRAAGERTLRGHNGGGPGAGINSEAMIVWETGDVYAVLGNYDAPFAQALAGDLGTLLARAPAN